jgi:hypothetical protein
MYLGGRLEFSVLRTTVSGLQVLAGSESYVLPLATDKC